MKMKNLWIAVLAAAMVVAITSGTVYAKSIPYNPNLVSHFDGSSVTVSAQPQGSNNADTNDIVYWGNVLYNGISRSVTGYIQDCTYPGNGLNGPYYTSTPIPSNSGTTTIVFTNSVADGSNPYTIYASHGYVDGYTGYGSPECTGMSFY